MEIKLHIKGCFLLALTFGTSKAYFFDSFDEGLSDDMFDYVAMRTNMHGYNFENIALEENESACAYKSNMWYFD